MSLKETILKDINRIFLNPDHFAEIHTLDGKPLTCVLEDPTTGTTRVGADPDLTIGVGFGDYVLRVNKSDLSKEYIANQTALFDGKPVQIDRVEEADGMIYLTMTKKAGW